MVEVEGEVWIVEITYMDSWSGPEIGEPKIFIGENAEKEAKNFAKTMDQRGQLDHTPEYYIIAEARKIR